MELIKTKEEKEMKRLSNLSIVVGCVIAIVSVLALIITGWIGVNVNIPIDVYVGIYMMMAFGSGVAFGPYVVIFVYWLLFKKDLTEEENSKGN